MTRLFAIYAVLSVSSVLGWAGTARADCPVACAWELCREAERRDDWAAVEASRLAETERDESGARWEIVVVHGGPGADAIAVGDRVDTGLVAGDRVVLVVDRVGTVLSALEIYGDDRVRCAGGSMGSARRADAIEAVLSADCSGNAEEAGLTGSCNDTHFGCSAAGEGPPGWAGLGLLVGFALVVRSVRERWLRRR